MILNIEHPNFIYNFFFALAHISSWLILIWYGYKHKYSIIHWLIIIVTGYIFFTIGSHILAFDVHGIKQLIQEGIWPASEGKSLISGLLLAVPSMLLMKHLLGFENAIFAPYAFSLPFGIAIQRIGCLGAGCCYGKATELPWGINYTFGHQIHYKQWANGQLLDIHNASIPIHPVQIYESIMCLVALIVIIYIYKKGWKQKRLVYVFLFLYSMIRFVTEMMRAPEAHTIGINSYMGLNSVQWIMLFSALAFIYVLSKKERYKADPEKSDQKKKPVTIKDYAWYVLLFLMILIIPILYSGLELLLLGLLFVPLSTLVFWEIFKTITVPQFRVATVSICVIGIFLMSQNSPIIHNESKEDKYHEISLGAYTGMNNMTHYYRGCDGDKHEDFRFEEDYYLAGIGYKYVNKINDDKALTIGVGASYGILNEHVENAGDYSQQDIEYSYQQTIYYLSPYVKYDLKKVGFGLGLLAGDISVFRDSGRPLTAFKRYSVLPQFHFRVGNLNNAWGEFNYGFRFPGVSPANEFELLLGIRGDKGNLVRVGTSAFNAIVIRPEFYINDKIGIEPYVGLFGPMIGSSYTDRAGGLQGGLNLHYRIR